MGGLFGSQKPFRGGRRGEGGNDVSYQGGTFEWGEEIFKGVVDTMKDTINMLIRWASQAKIFQKFLSPTIPYFLNI